MIESEGITVKPELIVMLTNHDITVTNAAAVFEACKDLPTQHWGFKDVGLPKKDMIALNRRMKEAGKTTYLEVVTYTEEGCMEGARLAGECGFDYLTGTVYYPAVMDVLKQYNMKYLPLPGKVGGSPVSLTGTIDEIVADSVRLIEAGADGVDLTSYRYTDGDPMELAYAVGRRIEMDKLTIAGSIGNTERMDKMNELGCKAYTMGSALFQGNFVKGGTFRENLEFVLNYREGKQGG